MKYTVLKITVPLFDEPEIKVAETIARNLVMSALVYNRSLGANSVSTTLEEKECNHENLKDYAVCPDCDIPREWIDKRCKRCGHLTLWTNPNWKPRRKDVVLNYDELREFNKVAISEGFCSEWCKSRYNEKMETIS